MIPVRCFMLCLIYFPIGCSSTLPDGNSETDTESTSDTNTTLEPSVSDTNDPSRVNADPRDSPKPETPGEAFQAIKQSLEAGDVYGFAACLSGDSQVFLVSSVLPVLHSLPAIKLERKDEVFALMSRHQISPGGKPKISNNIAEHEAMMADMRRQAGLVKDKPKFLAEFDKFSAGIIVDLYGSLSLAEIIDVTIDGDSASAQMTIGKRNDRVKFKRENGGWRLHIYNKDGSAAELKSSADRKAS